MKKAWNFVIAMSWPTIGLILAAIVVVGFMTFRLSTLTLGLAEIEVQTYNSANSLGTIFDNTINGPYKLAIYIITSFSQTTFALRLVGALVGILSVGVFYLFVRKLLSPTIAIATTLMFASTSLLLHTTRLASPEVMMLSLLAVIAVGFALRFHRMSDVAWITAAVVISLSLYVPGMFLFILFAAIFQFRHVRKSFEQLKPLTIIIVSVILSIFLAPLVISLIREPSLWRGYLGITASIPAISDIGKNMLQAFTSIFIYSKPDPVRHVGRQPVLDVFATALFIYGLINLMKQYKLDRFWLIFGLMLIGLIWIGVTGNISNIIILLPFLYLLAGIGLQNLVNKWMVVFPKNPIARTIGYSLVFITVALAINLHFQRYFIAWQHADETKAVFTNQITD